MDRAELAQTVQRNEQAVFRAHMLADGVSRDRFGFAVVRRAGLVCLSSARLPEPLFTRAIGFGVSVEPSAGAIDAVVRHYASLGSRARVEVAEGIAPARTVRLLERAGFERDRETHVVHVLTASSAPQVRHASGLRIAEVRRGDLRLFGLIARAGFEAKGERGDFVERSSAYVLAHEVPRFIGYIAWMGDNAAGTGALCIAARAGGLYSDSTRPEHRGRGIQKALIAARIERGLSEGVRIFTARTEGPNTSARNYAAVGFRPLYRAAFYSRDA